MNTASVRILLVIATLTWPGLLEGEVQQAWVARADGREYAQDIVVDAAGCVYVTGDGGTVKYDSSGNIVWSATNYAGVGIGLDANGNVYIAGGSAAGYLTVKYDAQGNEVWTATYSGPIEDENLPFAVAVDPAGNTYVTGWSLGIDNAGADYATVKYNSDGVRQWVARYEGAGSDVAIALALDAAGNVYVTGHSSATQNDSNDYLTIKYDAQGNELWVRRYDGPANSDDYAAAIAVDYRQNVVVTGRSYGSGTGLDSATVKYNSEGQELWVQRYNGPANGDDAAAALAVDSAGNVHVTGTTVGLEGNYDSITLKYDSAGHQLWAAQLDGPANGTDWASALALDQRGNVYVTGVSVDPGVLSGDLLTVKYRSNGDRIWTAVYHSPDQVHFNPAFIALDTIGNVYVVGSSTLLPVGPQFEIGFSTVKYEQLCPALPELIQTIAASELPGLHKTGLIATLQRASEALEANDSRAALRHLRTFQNQVRAQIARRDEALADELLDATDCIIERLRD